MGSWFGCLVAQLKIYQDEFGRLCQLFDEPFAAADLSWCSSLWSQLSLSHANM